MANAERQIPGHVAAAYREAVDNIVFLKRQQWLATNYMWLGVTTFAAFVVHWWVLHLFQRSIENFRNRLASKRMVKSAFL
jgi:hypothetical protein